LINYFKSYSSLGDDRFFCVTLYVGITIHFASNWKLHNDMLACRRYKGRHTYTYI